MNDIKVILLSKFPLPYAGIGSWTTMMNYHLKNNNYIDVVICPESEIKLIDTEQVFVANRKFTKKISNKLGFGTKHSQYVKAFSKQIKGYEKIIVQVIDDIGLLSQITNYIEKNNLRRRVYVQYFYHGFSVFSNSTQLLSKIDELILLSNSSYIFFKNNCTTLPVKISVNNNGVSKKIFFSVSKKNKSELRTSYQINQEKIVFVWCSQDRKKKGLDIILQAWLHLVKSYKDRIELLVIGVEKEVPIKNVRVIGRVPNHELAAYYQLSDFYLFPTLWHEGFGLSLAEALKCGSYCIASDNGAVSEVLGYGKYGILVANANMVQSWVEVIENEIERYDESGRVNPFIENIPSNLYDMDVWHNNSNNIVQSAKENFLNRYYL